MQKKIILCGVMASTLLGTGIFSNTASATEIQKNREDIVDYKNVGQQGAIEDIDRKIDSMIDAIPPYIETKWRRLGDGTVKISGVNIEKSNVTNTIPLFLGSNTFINDTDREMTYNTSTFSEEITTTTSTQIENGFKTGLAAEGKVGIPFVAEGKITTTLEYNFANTNTNTDSITKTITAPSQPVPVKPHSITKAEVYFEKKSTSGNVEIFADVAQLIIAGRTITNIGNGLDMTTNTYGLIKTPDNPHTVRVKGSGKFTTEYATDLIVKTYDVTSGEKSAKLIDSKRISIN